MALYENTEYSILSFKLYIKWLYYSKCPALLLPIDLKMYWSGFYIPSESNSPDLILQTGEKYDIDTTFDFDNPITDYDRACQPTDDSLIHNHKLIKVNNGFGVVFETPYCFTWYDEKKIFIYRDRYFESSLNNQPYSVFSKIPFEKLSWSEKLLWNISSNKAIILSSTMHGSMPDMESSKETIYIDFIPGKYIIEYAEYSFNVEGENDSIDLGLHRFKHLQ
jgi:hypothetical protein